MEITKEQQETYELVKHEKDRNDIIRHKEKNTRTKREIYKSFGSALMEMYVFFSSVILGNLSAFLLLFVYNDIGHVITLRIFGIYTILVMYGMIATTFSLAFLVFTIIALFLYHKSQSLIENDKQEKEVKEIKNEKLKTDKKKASESKMPEGFIQQKGIDFYTFDKIGDNIRGELIAKEKNPDWQFFHYTLKRENGEQVRIPGSIKLDELLINAKLGDMVFIQLTDIEEKDSGVMKQFIAGIKPKN